MVKDFILALCICITIGCAVVAGYCYHSHAQLLNAARTGRISTPDGVYYVTPSPTFAEYQQVVSDNRFLNKQLNRKRRK